MRNLENIEKSAFRRGGYVGYGAGVWSIMRYGKGERTWRASRQGGLYAELYAGTLTELSSQLKGFARQRPYLDTHGYYEKQQEGKP